MNAVLALEDGTWFGGTSVGAARETSGEVVFNTSMTGYQEVLTDPSYAGQIVTMTSVQIGNYGVTGDDSESRRPQVAGFVMRESSPVGKSAVRSRELHPAVRTRTAGIGSRSFMRTTRKPLGCRADRVSKPQGSRPSARFHGPKQKR